jgi:tripartite-type tricarboxylate transporter receptor subunit TctC
MRGHPVLLLCAVVMTVMIAAGCSSAAPASAPTNAPAAASTKAAEPAKAAEPTKPAAAAKVNYPQKGKILTIIVPFAAGGSTDIAVRLIAPLLEQDLGVSVDVVNKPGATTQLGATEFVTAKPDGYTLMSASIPTTLISYVDPARKAPYTAKSFVPVASLYGETVGLAVPTEHPFKTFQDFLDAAKTSKVKLGVTGLLGSSHLTMTQLEQETGLKFGFVEFDSGNAAIAAVLGGHVDVAAVGPGNMANMVKQGKLRILAMVDGRSNLPLYPDVPTTSTMGYKSDAQSLHMIVAPAGTPQGILDVLQASLKKVSENPDFKTKMASTGLDVNYVDAATCTKFWATKEDWVKSIFPLAKSEISGEPKK